MSMDEARGPGHAELPSSGGHSRRLAHGQHNDAHPGSNAFRKFSRINPRSTVIMWHASRPREIRFRGPMARPAACTGRRLSVSTRCRAIEVRGGAPAPAFESPCIPRAQHRRAALKKALQGLEPAAARASFSSPTWRVLSVPRLAFESAGACCSRWHVPGYLSARSRSDGNARPGNCSKGIEGRSGLKKFQFISPDGLRETYLRRHDQWRKPVFTPRFSSGKAEKEGGPRQRRWRWASRRRP